MFSWFTKSKGTFRPIKSVPKEQRYPKLTVIWKQTIVVDPYSGCKLPPGENLNEWIAVSTIDAFNQISYLYEALTDYCTPATCPEMTAGPGFKYAWQDNQEYKKPTMLPACDYIIHVMQWTESLINDDKIFVDESSGKPFPKDFMNTNKKIYQRLFRVYAHIYHHHMNDIRNFQLEHTLNQSFRSFMAFAKEYKMIPEDQQAALKSIIDQI